MRKYLLSFFAVLIAQAGFGQVDSLSSLDGLDTLDLPKGNVHSEFYIVAPAIEYIPGDETPETIQARLQCIEKAFPLTYNKNVHAFIEYFTVRDREYTKAMLRKKDLYFPIFEEYLKKYDLPDELKYLSIIESGLNPRAVSRAKAVGLWQFMHYTGKHYGLTTDWYWDDRMDPEKSTDAACRLLADLYKIFKDWPLALAAYNSGPGTVLRANKRSGYKNNFWDVYSYLPRETRSYVPQFIAIVYAMKYAEAHNMFEPYGEAFPQTDTIQTKSYLNVEMLASLTGTCLEEMHFLNPALKTRVLPANGKNHVLRMPLESKNILTADRVAILDSASKNSNLQNELASLEDGKELLSYVVKSGDALGAIANKYGVKQSDVMAWNGLTSNLIHPGQRLKIWVKQVPVSNSSIANVPSKSTVAAPDVYVVQAGDSLWDISRKYQGLTIEKIKELNNLSGNTIKPGQKLTLR